MEFAIGLKIIHELANIGKGILDKDQAIVQGVNIFRDLASIDEFQAKKLLTTAAESSNPTDRRTKIQMAANALEQAALKEIKAFKRERKRLFGSFDTATSLLEAVMLQFIHAALCYHIINDYSSLRISLANAGVIFYLHYVPFCEETKYRVGNSNRSFYSDLREQYNDLKKLQDDEKMFIGLCTALNIDSWKPMLKYLRKSGKEIEILEFGFVKENTYSVILKKQFELPTWISQSKLASALSKQFE